MSAACCTYVGGKHVMPGWGCGKCRCYNGLQREECRECGHPRCPVEVPANVARCSTCGAGIEILFAKPGAIGKCLVRGCDGVYEAGGAT